MVTFIELWLCWREFVVIMVRITAVFEYLLCFLCKPLVLEPSFLSLVAQKNYLESESLRMVCYESHPGDSKVQPVLRSMGIKDLI